MSKVGQLTALRAFRIDVPKTVAVVGRETLFDAAKSFSAPFVTKHNQGSKRLGVRRFEDYRPFAKYVRSDEFEVPVDGITLLQEYIQPTQPRITRVETVGYEYVYAISGDKERAGFQLCPADACELDEQGRPMTVGSLFALREGFHYPVIDLLLGFFRAYRLEITGFEFIEAANGRVVVYDVNTNTNYNPDAERIAPKSGPAESAADLRRVEADTYALA